MRKVCVVTANRADYSRLKSVLRSIKEHENLELMLFVAGSHLLSSYGETIKEIEKDGFKIAYRMHTEVEGRVPVTMAKSTGMAITELANAFYNFKPDIVVVHGDRFEALAASIAASLMNIFVAHIQGGEVTGTIDEHIRHAITKLSHAHFPSTADANERIIKIGEHSGSVFNFGCPSADELLSVPELSFENLKNKIFKYAKKEEWKKAFNENFILIVQHPVTTEYRDVRENMLELLKALKKFSNSMILLWPNIDAGSEEIVKEIKKFEREKGDNVGLFPNFPLEVFVNIVRRARVMVGNSSSGVREACYFGTPVVNVGTRQDGRQRTNNVIDVGYDAESITGAIESQLKADRYKPQYIYGQGNSGKRIADTLASIDVNNIQKKITF
jgi:UDP-hydrolysing UDP-N-acetyl-D-glucosamine 2-epimerase